MKQIAGALMFLLLLPASAGASCPVDEIKNKICEIEVNYDPIAFLTPRKEYKPPACTTTNVDAFAAKIGEVYMDSDLPSKFKDELCAPLKKIFIQPNTLNESWGKYEAPVEQNGKGASTTTIGSKASYVFLQNDLLSQKIQKVTSEHLDALEAKDNKKLSELNLKHEHNANGGRKKNELPLAIVSVLAHEVGHIKFHRDNIQSSSCFINKFQTASWDDLGTTASDRWRKFGEDIGKHKHNIPKPMDVDTQSASGKETLAKIYSGGFASALASESPEEDFVETYTLAVLKAFSTDELNLDLGGGNKIKLKGRSSGSAGDQRLQAKLSCVTQLVEGRHPMKREKRRKRGVR